MISNVKPERVRKLNGESYRGGPVVYWMSRDQRVHDNWALLYAQELAMRNDVTLTVIFCLSPRFLDATWRQYDFMIKGLEETETGLEKLNIPFHLLTGDPPTKIVDFLKSSGCGALISDFSPLNIKKDWVSKIKARIHVPFYEVDAHNIVPCWIASDKQEYAAYTIRPKITRLMSEYLREFPRVKKQTGHKGIKSRRIDWGKARDFLKVDRSVRPVISCRPGTANAVKKLRGFIKRGLERYANSRNDPNAAAQSGLSPYLHFGQLSAQRAALEVLKLEADGESVRAFIEELVVRRELSDNFCYYNGDYDSFDGFPEWARKTLNDHREDRRVYRYSLPKLENGKTHDELWNAAQEEMVLTGKMHGYLRMYWAKKILEWTSSPQEALQTAIYLNDRYQLDGRDPNGYAGIAWSIGGVHDRAWPEREIFGKIRYMSYEGCRRKFDVRSYIDRISKLGD